MASSVATLLTFRPSELPVLFGFGEFLPDGLEGLLARALPSFCWVSEPASGKSPVLRPG
jgi:hypothetical protein